MSVVVTSPAGDTTTVEMHWVVAEGAASVVPPSGGDGDAPVAAGDEDENEKGRLSATRLAQTGDEGTLGLLALGGVVASLAAAVGARLRLRRK